MTSTDKTRSITAARPVGPTSLNLSWSDGTEADIDMAAILEAAPRRRSLFAAVQVGDWGHSLVWPDGLEVGADRLWLETLSATGRDDTRRFLEWRLRHGLSLSGAAEALGISRRMVAYYSNGEKHVPRPILLACRGWEANAAEQLAA